MFVHASCVVLQVRSSEEIQKVVTDALEGEPSVETLYYAITSMANMGMSSKSVSLSVSL